MSTLRANRPSKEKAPKKEQQKEKDATKHNATAEQLRLATMITDKNKDSEDPVFLGKIAQVKELTGRSEDECCYALHDSDYDVERAIVILLENEGQKTEWQEAGKKKKEQPPPKIETPPPEMDKPEKSDKFDKIDSHERSGSAPRGRRDRGPPRFQRGRGRDNNINEGDRSENRERSNDGKGRGRGRGGSRSRGRGRGGGVGREGFRNNRDAPRNTGGGFEPGPQIDTWTNETAANAEKEHTNIGSWGDDWTADEWTGSLEESKVFTPSQPTESKNFINDNDAQMFSVSSIEKQAFTSTSVQDTQPAALTDTTNTYSPLTQPASHVMSPPKPIGQNSLGQRLDIGMLLKSPEAPVNSATQQENNFLAQFAKQAEDSIKSAVGISTQMNTTSDFIHSYKQQQSDFAKQTEESIKNAVGIGGPDLMSDYSKRAEQSIKSALGVSTSQSQTVSASQAPRQMVNQHPPPPPGVCVQQQQANTLNQQKKRKLPPPSKIPASAVEMPAGMNFQLDVQFGSGWESGDSGFSFGGTEPHNSYNTTSQQQQQQATLANHLPTNTTKPVAQAPSESTASVMTPPSSSGKPMNSLDSITAAPSQSPRPTPGPFHNTNTPPGAEFSQSNKISSPPDPIPFPSSQPDRKTSPYSGQRTAPTQGANKSSTSPQINAYNSSSNYSNYNNSYKSTSNNYPVSSLASNSLQGQRDYGTSNSYSSSSFQNATGSSGYGTGSQSSLYQNPNATSSFQGQSSSQYNSSSSSYPSQVSSASNFQSQPSYHSRQDNQNFQTSSNSQSGSSYQSAANSYQNPAAVSSAAQQPFQSDSQSSSQSGYNSQFGSGSTPNGTVTQTNSGSAYNSSNQAQQNSVQAQYNSINSSSQQSGVSISSSKLSDSLSKMSVKESTLEQSSNSYSVASDSTTTSTVSSLSSSSATTTVGTASNTSNSLGLSSTVSVSSVSNSLPSTTTTKSSVPLSNKTAPNLPPGVPVMGHSYMMGQPGHGMPFPAAFGLAQQPMYSYEDMQLLQQRIALPGYYDMQLQPPTTLTGLDQTKLNTVPYTASADGKLNRVDAQSPVNATGQSVQTSTQQNQSAGAGHSGQTFINTALPPGYANYYYPSGILPGGYSYTPTVLPQVPSATNAAPHAATSAAQFQKPGTAAAYGGYNTAFDALATQTHDFTKTFVSQNQSTKGSVSASSVTSTGSDLSGSAAGYGKTQFHSQQTVDKSGFHGNTPPLNLTGIPTGNQGGAMGGGAPYGQYMPVMTHQPHSQILHHHLQQDSSVNSSRGGAQQSGSQAVKATGPKGFSTAYWGGN